MEKWGWFKRTQDFSQIDKTFRVIINSLFLAESGLLESSIRVTKIVLSPITT